MSGFEKLQVRRGTAAQWTAANPVLLAGEPGYATDTGVLKVGDGSTAWEDLDAISGGSGAPTDADYLVGTSNGDLSAEIAVGATPGGELGGTWASPTVDATHSGSTHAATQAAAEATAAAANTADIATHAGLADPHTGYRLESADHTHQTTGAQAGQLTVAALSDSPAGELGGTWASPTVDATHAGSTHSAATDTHIADSADAHDASAISFDDTGLVVIAGDNVQDALVSGDEQLDQLTQEVDGVETDFAAHLIAADPHTGYRLESADHTHATTGAQAGNIAATSVTIADAGNDFTATTVEGALDELQADNEAHVAAGDPHTGYRLESADHTHASTGAEGGTIAGSVLTGTPGGELGGTFASFTVDATHSGSTHAAAQAAAEATAAAALSAHEGAADPHAGYLKESVLSEANVTDLTDGGATTLHSHDGAGATYAAAFKFA